MWKIAALCFILLAAVSLRAAEKQKSFIEELLEFNTAKEQAFANEEKKLWKQVKWQTSAADAIKLAQKENKPIVCFFLVREDGKSTAAQC